MRTESSEQQRPVPGLRWLSLGRSARVAWGRCQGSVTQPYRTVVSAERPSTAACTCASRQRPCKHARELADLTGTGQLSVLDEPDWVVRLAGHGRFTEPASPDHPHSAGPVDPEAATRRLEARREKVTAGLAELQLWLDDQVRTGLAALPRAGYGHFDAIAARMVDAQAPAVASTLRALPADLVSADWPGRALHVLGGLHLLAEAHRRLDDLPDELAATVRSRVGYPVSKETVRTRPPVVDRWWAIAGVDEVEFQLTSRRVWLRGLDSGRWALWLTFAPPGRDLDTTIQPGRTYACAAHFYPGSGQHRALIEPPPPDPDLPDPDLPDPDLPDPDLPAAVGDAAEAVLLTRSWGGDDANAIRAELAGLLAGDPWASRLPVAFAGVPVPPRTVGDPWLLQDTSGATVPLVDLGGDPWPLVAQSGGEPLQVMGEYDGRGLRVLAVLPDEQGRRYSTEISG